MNQEISSDAETFRRVMGRVPTGVAVVTSELNGERHGLVVGSFTSLSLDPPLVAFMPAKSSTTWPRLAESGSFCINVLSAEQAEVCRSFFSKDDDRFERFSWSSGVTGAPILDEAIAWIDCDLETVHDGGDHHIVLGRVRDMQARTDVLPLIFFSGGYGQFSGHSIAAWGDATAVEQLRYVDIAHGQMLALSRTWQVETLALVREQTDMMVLASTGSEKATQLPTRVGLRLPIVPPMGALLVGWDGDRWVDWWLDQAGTPEQRASLQAKLDLVRERGYSLVLASEDESFDELVARQSQEMSPEIDSLRSQITNALDDDRWEPDVETLEWPVRVRTLSAPVLTPRGNLAFMLTVFGLGRMNQERAAGLRDDVIATAARITKQIADHAAVASRSQ